MIAPRSAATRAELLRARRLLDRVNQGAALLRRKREALVRALVPMARPVVEERRKIADEAASAYAAELDALALHGAAATEATGWPPRAVEVELGVTRVWGITAPQLDQLPAIDRDLAGRATAPMMTGPALFEAANRFEALARDLLAAASREAHVRALGAALSRTSRQVHTLEQRVAPQLAQRVTDVSRALAEQQREDQTRLRKLRDRRKR